MSYEPVFGGLDIGSALHPIRIIFEFCKSTVVASGHLSFLKRSPDDLAMQIDWKSQRVKDCLFSNQGRLTLELIFKGGS